MSAPYQKTLTLSLVAAVNNGVSQAQAGVAATPLTLNGSLATAGVATFDAPRRVGVASTGNDTGITFTVVGTDYYGRAQTEVLTGANNATAQTVRDFATVTSITPSGNTAANVTAGTTNTGSTPPHVLDAIANPASVSLAGIVTGVGVTWTAEQSFDDLSPAWNVNATPPTYFPTPLVNQAGNAVGALTQPATLLRLTLNSTGTGSVALRIVQALLAGAA